MISPYEEAELEKVDLRCKICGDIISTATYLENEEMICNKCLQYLLEHGIDF